MRKTSESRKQWQAGTLSCPNKAEYMTDDFKADAHARAASALDGVDPRDIALGKYGNSKIHAEGTRALTLVYSGLAHHDCPGATDSCRKTCYAMGFRYLDAAGKSKGTSFKYSYLAHHDIPRLEAVIMREIEAGMRKAKLKRLPLAVRIHEAGDFVSVYHVAMWDRIATAFPQVKFWAYTRSDMVSLVMAAQILMFTGKPNVSVRSSHDPLPNDGIPDDLERNGLPAAIIVGKSHHGKLSGPARVAGAVNCPEQVTRGEIGCADCGLCFHPARPAIRFYKH